ncbi:MAG: hypothetical protein K6G73_00660 [Marinilabiliaceae bacterium]|nr:hypothetical protein [Marinilabiliaceae bacterium]
MIGITPMFVSDDGIVFIDSEKTQKLSLKISHSANDIGDDIDDYNMEMLHLGFNRSEPHSISDHCRGTKDEGYEVSTTVIVDNPVEIIPKKDNSSLCIDNCDKCEFSLNDFYVTKDTEFKLSIKLTSEDDNCWREDVRTFKPKQEIALSYEEILSIAGITDKFAWSGKNISIKITKKLIDDSWSESNVVLCTFIHKGPDFEIETVRRTNCSNKVELIVKSEQLSDYLGKGKKFDWEVKEEEGGISADVDTFEFAYMPDVYKLKLKSDDAFYTRINEYEKKEPDKEHPWLLQLQEKKGEQEKDSSVAYFTTKQFEIAPRAPQITISQYTDEGIEVESGLDPYIRIKIEDLDTYYDNGRVPYKVYEVYDKNKEEYLTEFNNRIDAAKYNETQLKSIFNSQYPKFSWNITEESYKKKRFEEWYDDVKDKNNGLDVRTIISSQKFEIEAPSKLPALDNVICNGKVLYFYNIQNWGRIMFSTEHPFSVDNQNNKSVIKISDETYYIEESSGKLKKNTANQSVDVQNFGYAENTKFDFLAQSSNSILVCKDNVLRIFKYGSNNVLAQTDVYTIQNNFKNPEVYFVSINGQPYINIKNNGITYCSDGNQLYEAKTLYTPNSISEIKMSNGLITYVSNGTTYNQSKDAFSKGDLFLYFKNKRAVIPKTHFDSDWTKFQEERKKEYAQFLAKILSYRVSGMKHYKVIEKNDDIFKFSGKLKIKEIDGCYSEELDYTFQYRNVKFKEEVTKYPTSLSANDGVVKLTLIEGGLVSYIVNGSSLNIGDVVEVSGCGYGEKKIMVKDDKGNEFPYSIYIPLPDYEIEPSNQICSVRGGEIVLTCKNEALKLNSYFLYRQGEYINKYTAIDNGKTITFSGLKPDNYQVWGVFDNGNHVLLSESQTIADESFSVDVTIVDAKEINQGGTVTLVSKNAQGNVGWQEFIDNSPQSTGKKGASISLENVAIGEHKYFIIGNKGCTITKTVEVSGPEISMNVDIAAKENSAYIRIEDIKSQNISDYHFEVNGEKVENFSNISYDSSKNFKLDLKYQTTPQGEVYTYNIINQKLNSGTITISDASDKNRCSGTDGQLKIVAEDIPENVKCYYQIANTTDGKTESANGETKFANGETNINLSHGDYIIYVIRKQSFSVGQINVNLQHDSQTSINVADGTPTDAIVIAHDVKCKGANDGYIEIRTNRDGIPQNVWLCRDKIREDEASKKQNKILNLQPGQCVYYVVDGRCISLAQKDSVIITEPSNTLTFEFDRVKSKPTCKDNDGIVIMKVSGGWGDYKKIENWDEYQKDGESYLASQSATNSNELTYEGLSSGDHKFIIVDEELCKIEASINLPEYVNPQITDTTTIPARCYGSADGEIVINAVTVDCSVEDKPLSLLIEGRSDTLILTNPYKTTIEDLSKGFYKLQLMDVNGCQSDILNVPISEPEPLKVEALLLDGGRILYKGGNKGRMEVKVSGGNVGIDSVFYNNSNVLVSTGVPYIVEGMSAGPISITASDRYNCPCNDTTLTFIEPEEPITIEAESQAALCHAQTGSVKVTATGGWGDHIIRLVGERESRNKGEQSETTFESLYAGDYKIEVEDKYGAKATQSVRVDAPEPISHELITTPDNCDGNGSATIKLSGGMPDYTTIFVVGTDTTEIAGSTVNIGNLVGGREYELHTRDANTCESVITFPQPDNRLKAEIKYAYNANGSATLTAEVKGGIAPYIYKWRNVSGGEELGTSSTQTVTKSGLYRLEIADASGCSYKTMQDVLMAGSIVMRVKSVTRVTNPENNNGTATIICKATQEVNLRLYHLETDTWTTIQNATTTINLEGLQWGHYCVEGELDNGNMQTAMFFIAPYEPMEVMKIDVKHVSAPGRNDASVVVDFDGGIAPYVLNSATYPTGHIELENLAAGKITLSIADSTGNILTKDVEILEPKQPLVVTPSRVDSASCFSYSDGSVLLTATGGWSGYQFANGNGDYRNSAYFGSLNAGERIFKVVDKYGVEDSVKVTIGEPDMLRASVAAIDSVRCKGDNDGAAHFTVTGGTAPYRTIYEKETLDGTDVENLLSGSYVMKFTDSHNCKSPDTISIYIPEPDLLELANDYVTHTTCELDNGKIAIEVKGGSLPYIYEWKENGATYGGAKTVNMVRSEAENLKQNGFYEIEIFDRNNCKTKYEKGIEHSDNPQVMGVATTDVLCYGSSDGIAEVDSSQVKWGYPKVNYHLTWPQGQTGVMSVNTLPAGRHTVRITDDNNCTTTREFTVGTPEPVKNHLAGLRDALCYSYSDGRIETHTTGGVGDYTYVWNTGETTSYADSLKAGMYKVVVTDSHECKDSATYEVTEPEELKVNLGNDLLICPGNIHVFDAGEYATYSWRNAASGEEIETERYLATGDEGDYAIKVTDEIGCIARDTVNITIGENALEANFLMASDAAVNDTIMLVELSNLPVDSVRWEYEPLTVVDIDDAESYMLNLSAENTGRYYITMWAYSGGCESFEQKFIDIYEAVADTSDFKIGYDPLIKQAKVSPNPNDGEFDLIIVLRETYDIDVTVYDVNNGRQVEHVVLKDSDRYNTRLNIKQWGSGIFVLSIVSGTERRAIKVLCVR